VGSIDLGPLPHGYRELLDRAVEVLRLDSRVLAVWLSGSLARGDADAQSDLDLILAVTDEGFEPFGQGWEGWLASITPTVLAKRIAGLAGFYAVTPEWLRLDVLWEPERSLPASYFRTRRVVFDRGGYDARVPVPVEAPGPSAERVRALTEECLRILGLLPTAIGREDFLLGVEGVWTQRLLLYQLYQQANAPLPQTGLKQWSTKLVPAQRARLAALPTGSATREGVIEGSLEVSRAFLEEARPLCRRLGVEWPDALERATREHLRRTLGIEV
jgi:hypothetical protein